MTDNAHLTDVLAQKRTTLAVQRTLMAADRSLMAWVRTGLSMIGFGFSFYAFIQSLASKGTIVAMSVTGPRRIGLLLLALGILSVLFGSIQYWAIIKDIKKTYAVSPRRFPLIMAALIGFLGVVLFVSLLLKISLL